MIKYLLLMTLVGCGQFDHITGRAPASDPRDSTTTDEAMLPYSIMYEKDYGTSVSNISLGFGTIPEGKAGMCYTWRDKDGKIIWAQIKIDQLYWQTITEKQRMNLIYHEMGHCAQGRDHLNSLKDDKCPVSFMYSSVMNKGCLDKHLDEYIGELPNK
jgi:hypothetical protein